MKFTSFYCFLLLIASSCTKDNRKRAVVEGYVLDKISQQPVADVQILVEAVKNGTGSIISFGGRSETLGYVKTDANGYYKASFAFFPEADHLMFYVNPVQENQAFTFLNDDLYLSDMNDSGRDTLNFSLTPVTLLKISFKNTAPVSETDTFSVHYMVKSGGWSKGIAQDTCGTVMPTPGHWWVGQDVCGSYTVQMEAERMALISWDVRKAGVKTYTFDSTFLQRGVLNKFDIRY